MIYEIIEGDERELSFEMRIFAQMAASVTLSGMSTRDAVISIRAGLPVLCSEAFLHTKYVTQ